MGYRRKCKIAVKQIGKRYHLVACNKPVFIGDADNQRDFGDKPWPAIFKDHDIAEDFAKQIRRYKLTIMKNRVRVHI